MSSYGLQIFNTGGQVVFDSSLPQLSSVKTYTVHLKETYRKIMGTVKGVTYYIKQWEGSVSLDYPVATRDLNLSGYPFKVGIGAQDSLLYPTHCAQPYTLSASPNVYRVRIAASYVTSPLTEFDLTLTDTTP